VGLLLLLQCHRWHKDIVVDIVGYRRNGHNELDDPRVTLPLSYQLIQQHPTVLEIYARKLQVRGGGKITRINACHVERSA
jgi:2-oxoglutarate dehydrogenase E1 component